ncbi:PilW family protein [Pseudomonas sp. GV071]|uniref:PilW family protein n=1 Tax=Pseudomonas sp. GV071 TaxID=2135754 RepID=UPI000D3CA2E8|nr:PilW family protein [Pseudomonas sp. GV071]PTQ67682.1 type IV pilus assembly protein PilW [Pseudomonas sp. GV071]
MKLKQLQTGLSLIELLVGMAISCFLILGVTQIYIDNKKTYAFQQNLSENQEGTRFALLFLQNELGKTGYRRRPDEPVETAFPVATASGCTFAAGQTVKYVSANSICIRYQPKDENDRDCVGNKVATASDFTTPYTKATEIFTEKLSVNASHELVCTRGTNDAVLISGVMDLRFEFGVGSATSPQVISAYIKTAPSTSQPVLSVRYSTLLRSTGSKLRESVDADAALANWKELLGASDAEVTAVKTLDKGQIYQVSQNTVMLRNRMP